MKKIFLLIFVLFCMLIFYQMILGTNGLIEGYKTKKEKERLLYYKILLEKHRDDLISYIQYLKTDTKAMNELANRMGFFKEPVNLIKIIDKKREEYSTIEDHKIVDKILEEIEKDDAIEKRVKTIKTWTTLIFFIFFAGFIILIIFSGVRDEKGV